jgi:hypothetical protein
LAFNTDTYFSPSAEYNPFVHTWSLGVEEQYYLIFPVLFYLTVKNKAKYALESLFVLSFLLSVHHTFDNTNHAYYLLTSRFWELAAGAMLFMYHNSKVKETAVSKYYSYFGVVCIIISMAFSNKAMFPFPWAVFSVLGTCLLIHAIVITQRRPLEKNALIRLSETNIASHFGKLSYSLYLWHWPIFTLFRWSSGLESPLEIVIALLMTYVFSLASYYFLEKRVPKLKLLKQHSSESLVYIGLGAITLLTFTTFMAYKGQPILSVSVTANKNIWSPYTDPYSFPSSDRVLSGKTIYVLGDSHAAAYKKMLAKLSKETGANVQVFSKGGCGFANLKQPVLVDINPCYSRLQGWIEKILKEATADDIIFLATLKVERLVTQANTYPGLPTEVVSSLNEPEVLLLRNKAIEESLINLPRFLDKTTNIIIVAPKPLLNSILFCCSDWYTKYNPICSFGTEISREIIEQLRKPSNEALLKITNVHPDIVVWDPINELCSDDLCSGLKNGRPIYFDSDHLSAVGNELVYESFKELVLDVTNN